MKTTTTKAPKVALCKCATALGERARKFAHNVKEVDV